MASMFARLMRDSSYQRAFEEAAFRDDFAYAALSCRDPAVAAFRCADLRGFTDPRCLHRRLLHSRCAAESVAPKFLERLETCETSSGDAGECGKLATDLERVVDDRMKHHVTSLVYTPQEERGVSACGLARDARSQGELEARLQCLAPFVCADSYARAHKCFIDSGSLDGACAPLAVELSMCMGESHARLLFHI